MVATAALLSPVPAWADREIRIETNWLDPPVVTVTVAERVSIINRTGQMVHVEFQDDPGRHMVVQIPGGSPIRVTFRRTGSHPYVVHFPGTSRPDLQGRVEVLGDPRGPVDPQACAEQTTTGVCLER